MNRRCPIEGCTEIIPAGHLLCLGHWMRLSPRLKQTLRNSCKASFAGETSAEDHEAICREAIEAVNAATRSTP